MNIDIRPNPHTGLFFVIADTEVGPCHDGGFATQAEALQFAQAFYGGTVEPAPVTHSVQTTKPTKIRKGQALEPVAYALDLATNKEFIGKAPATYQMKSVTACGQQVITGELIPQRTDGKGGFFKAYTRQEKLAADGRILYKAFRPELAPADNFVTALSEQHKVTCPGCLAALQKVSA